MKALRVRWIEEFGTQWPVLTSWTQSRRGVLEGDEGILKLTIDDGTLIDPARRQAVEASRPAGWELIRTRNGAALMGTYPQSGAGVFVFVVRGDESHAATREEFGLPEIQATYVLVKNEEAVASAIRDALQAHLIPPAEYGRLDVLGHAAMGPVPILTSWAPVGQSVDNSRRRSVHLGEAHLLLVGGGYLTFADDSTCCGFMLEPLPWREFDARRVMHKLEREMKPRGLVARLIENEVARVWHCQISQSGFSYTVSDNHAGSRGLGAFWRDVFSQVWRLHYWFGTEHGFDSERALRNFSASQAEGRVS